MTILFSDIRSFTAVSDSMTPEEISEFTNTYTAVMAPIIRRYSGSVERNIENSIMAVFPERPSNAIDAAIAMLNELHQMNLRRKEKELQPISIGIGIHTDSQLLKTLKEKRDEKESLMSDAFSIAARLEELSKAYSSSLLVSMDVMEKVENKDIYYYRHLDTVKVKKKDKSVHILEILNGNSQRIIDIKLKTREAFERGITLYHSKEFIYALKCFKYVLKDDSRDTAAELYVNRCNQYLEKGVAFDWDGVEQLEKK